MELARKDIKMTQGLAILTMVSLHLFCRLGTDVYGTPLLWLNSTTPAVYILGWLSEICIPLYSICSGYAHYKLGESGGLSKKRICNRIIKFLINFWIVCILFAVIGVVAGTDQRVPGSWKEFFGNMFFISTSYNGAWWYVDTYLILVMLSPILYKITKKVNSIGMFLFVSGFYLIKYVLNHFGYGLSSENQISDWMIMQYNNLTGSVLTCYIFGMLCAKKQLFTKVKTSSFIQKGKNPVVLLVMLTISIITYCLQKALIMPFYGLAVFVLFNLWEKGKIAEKIWLFLGKHSTNIWLTHMFFYLYIFIGAIQRLQYPVLMFGGMIAVCVAVSVVILKLHEIICDRKGNNRSFAWN